MAKKIVSAFLLTMALAFPAKAAVISYDFNDNSADQTPGSVIGWSVENGSVDVIGAGGSFDWYTGNGSYLDLDGSAGALGQNTMIKTIGSFTFDPGKYVFSFDFGLNQNDSANDTDLIEAGLFFANTYIPLVFADAGALGLGGNAFSTASGLWTLIGGQLTAQLYIRGTSVGGSDLSGALVDNLRVSAVPLPGAALLLLSGLLGLGGVSRLRRKAT